MAPILGINCNARAASPGESRLHDGGMPMAQANLVRTSPSGMRLIIGFVAAFLATIIFHQIGLLVLHRLGLTAGTPWQMTPVPPFGVPRVISLAFWGGIWGIVFVLIERILVRCPGGYWVGAIVFGAIFPTVFSWLVVAPLKGLPLGYGFHASGIVVGLIVNGLWGLGTGVFLAILPGAGSRPG